MTRPMNDVAVAFHVWRSTSVAKEARGYWELILADRGEYIHSDGTEMTKECRAAGMSNRNAYRYGRFGGLGYCHTHGQHVVSGKSLPS